MSKNVSLIHQNSMSTEWFTPGYIIDRVHAVLGEIELDPASCEEANKLIRAKQWFGVPNKKIVGEINGFPLIDEEYQTTRTPWPSKTLFMNHPFGVTVKPCKEKCDKKSCRDRGYHTLRGIPGNTEWIKHLERQYQEGIVKESINICFASTSEGWFRPLLKYPICFVYGRVSYDLPSRKNVSRVPKGSCLVYMGKNALKFSGVFSDIGAVYFPAKGVL